MKKLPRLVSLVPQRFEDGGFSGVPRFDWELRRALPGLESVSTKLKTRAWLRWLAWREPDAIVITGNETSLLVPDELRTVVVHHGCAQTHFDRDSSWRGATERAFCQAQRDMYRRPNRWFVATAGWTSEQFSAHHGVPLAPVLPCWVERIERASAKRARPVVLGDFRTANKGSDVLPALQQSIPHIELRPLVCTYETRKEVYASADAYLCLSMSEGGSYAMSDAEAADLPLVTTDVGNYREYTSSRVIPWQQRGDAALVSREIERALAEPRGPSFFESYSLEVWQKAWLRVVEEVADVPNRAPLL